MDLFILKAWAQAKMKAEDGANLAEYALLLVLIAVVALVAVRMLGESASTRFSAIASELK